MFERDARADNADRIEESAAADNAGMGDFDLETPDVDAAEQRALVGEEHAWPQRSPGVGFDVNEADAADQDRIVELDEDDYR